jgi:hypothetical protein
MSIIRVVVRYIHERTRELCAKLVVANDSEVEAILSELRAVTQQHDQFVKLCAGNGLNHASNTADRLTDEQACRERDGGRPFLLKPSRLKNKSWGPPYLLQ